MFGETDVWLKGDVSHSGRVLGIHGLYVKIEKLKRVERPP